MATDESGNIVVVWEADEVPAGVGEFRTAIFAAYSHDAGATWNGPVTVHMAATATEANSFPAIAVDATNRWVTVWQSGGDAGSPLGADFDLLWSASTDAGATWTLPAPLSPDAAADQGDDLAPTIAAWGSSWRVAWSSNNADDLTILPDYDILTAQGDDTGPSWTMSSRLHGARSSFSDDLQPSLSVNKAGQWLLMWYAVGSGPVELLDLMEYDQWSKAAYLTLDPTATNGNVFVHWGESWSKGSVDMSSQPNFYNPSIGGVAAVRSEKNLIFGNSGQWSIPSSVQSSTTIQEVWPESGNESIRTDFAKRLYQNQSLDFLTYDYAALKQTSQLFGRYFSTDASGNIYSDGIEDDAHRVTFDDIMSVDYNGTLDGEPSEMAQFIFIDTLDGNPPAADFSNLASLQVSGTGEGTRFMNGIWIVNAHLDISGIGSSSVQMEVIVPDRPDGWPATVDWPEGTQQFIDVIGNGIVLIAGNLEVTGQPGFRGALITYGAVNGNGTPNVYADPDIQGVLSIPQQSWIASASTTPFGQWLPVHRLSPEIASPVPFGSRPSVTYHDGNWVAAWSAQTEATGSDADIFRSRSTDGVNWTPGIALNLDATLDAADDIAPALLSIGNRLLVVWSSGGDSTDATGEDSDMLYRTSTDGGVVWSYPVPVDRIANSDSSHESWPVAFPLADRRAAILWTSDRSVGGGLEDTDLWWTATEAAFAPSVAESDAFALDTRLGQSHSAISLSFTVDTRSGLSGDSISSSFVLDTRIGRYGKSESASFVLDTRIGFYGTGESAAFELDTRSPPPFNSGWVTR